MRSKVYVTIGRLSVCPVDRQQRRRPAGLLLSAGVCSVYPLTAAGAMLPGPDQF